MYGTETTVSAEGFVVCRLLSQQALTTGVGFFLKSDRTSALTIWLSDFPSQSTAEFIQLVYLL